jgi:hypothetical protein
MDLYRIIGDLVDERNRLQRIIESLEAMEGQTAKPVRSAPAGRGRKSMDHAARKEVSERMKQYWAKRRQKSPEDAS